MGLAFSSDCECSPTEQTENHVLLTSIRSGGNGLTRPIPGDEGADQLRGVPIIGKPPRNETRDPE